MSLIPALFALTTICVPSQSFGQNAISHQSYLDYETLLPSKKALPTVPKLSSKAKKEGPFIYVEVTLSNDTGKDQRIPGFGISMIALMLTANKPKTFEEANDNCLNRHPRIGMHKSISYDEFLILEPGAALVARYRLKVPEGGHKQLYMTAQYYWPSATGKNGEALITEFLAPTVKVTGL